MIKYIDELSNPNDLVGKRILLRLDLNAAIVDGKVFDDFRIQKIIPTIDYLRECDAQTVIVSHIEDSTGKNTSLLPVFEYLKGYFPLDFCPTFFTPEAIDKLLKLKDKDVLLFENVRFNPGEKENDLEFAEKLSGMGDIYINDAFGVSHREHASIVGVPKFIPHYGGLLMRAEVEHLSRIFTPMHPFVFIIGGAKFDTKLPLIKKYLDKADYVFVGGALSNNFLKEKGFEIGTSLISPGDFGLKEMVDNKKLVLPVDVTVTNPDASVSIKLSNEVLRDECIVDAGPETLNQIGNLLKDVKTIVWNGPLGNYEIGFIDKTEFLAKMIAEATALGAESILGGGDTIAAINKLGLNHKFTFISTGGGAMLDYLVNETLPGIEALEN